MSDETHSVQMDKQAELDAANEALFRPYLDAVTELTAFVDVALKAVHDAQEASDTIELLRKAAVVLRRDSPLLLPEIYDKSLEHAKTMEEFAKAQVDQGFPLVLNLATIRLWSIVEALCDDVAADLLSDNSTPPADSILNTLSGPLLSFLEMDSDDRKEYILELLARKVWSSSHPGIAKFEALLEPLGLSGHVDPKIRKCLLELAEVRHVITHRDGKADSKLLTRCPWLRIPFGSKVTVDRRKFHGYAMAVNWYIFEVRNRWQMHRNDPDMMAPEVIAEYDQIMADIADQAWSLLEQSQTE